VKRLLSLRWLAFVASCACALGLAVVGVAHWTSSGSGASSGTVATLSSPSTTATSPTYGSVHVAWSAVTLSPSVPSIDPEVTFTVERKPAAGSSWVYVCGTGTTPKAYNVLSCDDPPPATDTYDYRVVGRLRSWTSPGTASVSVIVDTVAPTSTITFPGGTVYTPTSWNASCSSSICGTASDSGGSGLQKVEVSLRRGSGNYWNGSSFSSATPVWNAASGTSAWTYAFAASSFPADDTYTVAARATDSASNVQSPVSSQAFAIDTTPPTVTATTIAATTGTGPAGYVKQGGGYAVYADASDANGLVSLAADVSAITTGQTAVALAACSSSCTVAGHTYLYKSAALTAKSPLSEGAKSYSVTATDVAGWSNAPLSGTVVVDNTAPSVATVIAASTGTSPQGFVTQGGSYRVYANISDLPSGAGASSGVDASSITADVSSVTSGQSAAALLACGSCGPGSAYAYQSSQLTASNPLSEGSKMYSVSARDNLGSSASAGSNVQVDNTAPSVVAVIANTTTGEPGWLAQLSGYRVYANVTELPAGAGASSGLNASSITADVSAVTSGQTAAALTTSGCPCTVGGTSYAYRSSALASGSPLSAGSKSFTVAASDNLGSTTTQSGTVTIDNTAPTLSTLQMFDVDADGKVDQVKATFGETLETYSAGTTPWTLANAPGGASNTLASVSVGTTVATLMLNEGTVNTASGSFTTALSANANGIRDLAGNQSTLGATSVADKAAPVPTNVVLANVTTLGQARSQDTVTVTYSETMDATSFCSTWNNVGTQTISGGNVVDVLVTDGGSADLLTVADVGSNCGGATNFKFGSVNLAANYVNANTTFSGTSSNQGKLTWNPSTNTLTITLGAGTGSQTGVAASTPIYTPSTAPKDLASPGNAMAANLFSAPATSRF
jgi:hypothetical protein